MEAASKGSLNWKLCCLCQQETDEDVRCPANQKRFHTSYETLEKDLYDLKNANTLPKGMEVLKASSMLSNKAVFHKSCRTNYNQTMVKRAELKRKRTSEAQVEVQSPKKTRSMVTATVSHVEPECILCRQNIERERLHKASTDAVDSTLKSCATKTRNTELLAKLATASDLHAMDAYYHRTCYVKLENAARSVERAESVTQSESEHYFNPLVVAELVAYILESKRVFPLNELKVRYTTKMKDLGRIVDPKSIHSTRLKVNLLKIEPEIIEASEGRGRASMLCSKETAGMAIETELKSQNEVGDNEACMIVQTALFLRKQILFEQKPFDGHFYPDCLRSPIPESLLAFMNVALQGPTGTSQTDVNNNEPDLNQQRSRVACTLSQLMIFNTAKRTRAGALMMRHSKERETPFPLYFGLKLHVEGKFKHLINVFEKLGLAITYIREQQVSKCLSAAVSEQIRTNGVVIPSDMRQNVFTTGDMDNIDQHKQSNSSKVEFHGTLITLTNHVSNENPGVVMEPLDISKVDKSQRSRLPDFYTIVPLAELDVPRWLHQ